MSVTGALSRHPSYPAAGDGTFGYNRPMSELVIEYCGM